MRKRDKVLRFLRREFPGEIYWALGAIDRARYEVAKRMPVTRRKGPVIVLKGEGITVSAFYDRACGFESEPDTYSPWLFRRLAGGYDVVLNPEEERPWNYTFHSTEDEPVPASFTIDGRPIESLFVSPGFTEWRVL